MLPPLNFFSKWTPKNQPHHQYTNAIGVGRNNERCRYVALRIVLASKMAPKPSKMFPSELALTPTSLCMQSRFPLTPQTWRCCLECTPTTVHVSRVSGRDSLYRFTQLLFLEVDVHTILMVGTPLCTQFVPKYTKGGLSSNHQTPWGAP